ncbi:MAG: histidine kinase [Rikenellaceae bacterium]|nr:histidine kinase [Rikenellaceae bacterium]
MKHITPSTARLNIKSKTLFIHIAAWLGVLIFTIVNIDGMSINSHSLHFKLPLWILSIILFYINYLILLPRLAKNRRTLYAVCSFLLVISCIASYNTYIHYLFNRNRPGTKTTATQPQKVQHIVNHYNPFTRRNQPTTYRFLLVYAVSLLFGLTKQWKEEEQRLKEIEREHIASELNYLKAQINPHFLFNALNSIYSLTIPHSEKASNAVLKLSSILRYMLYETDRRSVSLSDELSVIENYLGLQQLRLTDKTSLSFVKSGTTDHYRIEPLLLVPLIENAFKHGVDSSEPSYINIGITVTDGRLLMEVTNKIVSTQKNSDIPGGLGIKNIRRRLELLYPGRHTLSADESDGIFRVRLSIPLGSDRLTT